MRCCGDTNSKMGYVSVTSAIKDLLRLEGDTTGRNLMKYKAAASEVYEQMNLHAIKDTKRVRLHIDKQKRTAKLPDDFGMLSSVCIEDECGHLITVVINNNLKTDVVDISQDKDCHCECGCHSKECGIIQNYEVKYEMVQAVMPDGSSMAFTAYTRKKVNADGSFVEEINWPTAIYENGVWTDTRIVTTEKFLCKLDVKPCGCIVDSPKNKQRIDACCGANFFPVDCGCGICAVPCDIPTYNIEIENGVLVFPSDFPSDTVLLRYYYNASTDDLYIPTAGRRCFYFGIKAITALFDKKETEANKERFNIRFNKELDKLRMVLDRYSLRAFYEYVLGQRKMP